MVEADGRLWPRGGQARGRQTLRLLPRRPGQMVRPARRKVPPVSRRSRSRC